LVIAVFEIIVLVVDDEEFIEAYLINYFLTSYPLIFEEFYFFTGLTT
jgi:hypothetical protein